MYQSTKLSTFKFAATFSSIWHVTSWKLKVKYLEIYNIISLLRANYTRPIVFTYT